MWPQACNFIKKETVTQVFSCEFCEILRTPFLENTSGRLLLTNQFLFSSSLYFQQKELNDVKYLLIDVSFL